MTGRRNFLKSSLCVVQKTEQILVSQRGARLGNFGVADVSSEETWVTVAEWMQTWGAELRPAGGQQVR